MTICYTYCRECHHLAVVVVVVVAVGVASLSDLTGYAGGKFMFQVGLPGPDNPYK
jgi:hypothetical protein